MLLGIGSNVFLLWSPEGAEGIQRNLTSKLTGPEQQDGIWASMKCKPKCRHAV